MKQVIVKNKGKSSKDYQREILDLIRKGIDSCKEIRKKIGMEKRRQLFCYHKHRLISKCIVEEENGKLKIVLDPNRIANKERLESILSRVKSQNAMVRKLGIDELLRLSRKKILANREALDFLSKANEMSEYSEFKTKLQEILLNTIEQIRGTKFEKEFYEFASEELLKAWALGRGNNPRIRTKAINGLINRNQFDVLFNLVVEPEETYKGISDVVWSNVLRYVEAKGEDARKELYNLLEKHRGDPEISGRIYDFLQKTMDYVEWE